MPDTDFMGLRALVIDDEIVMRELISRYLVQLGISDVVVAADGFEALEKFSPNDNTFDLVICDIGMPNMNGIEFVKRLRAAAFPDRGVPVLVITGHGELEIVESALETGIQGYLVKPVTMKALESRIAAAVGSRGPDTA